MGTHDPYRVGMQIVVVNPLNPNGICLQMNIPEMSSKEALVFGLYIK